MTFRAQGSKRASRRHGVWVLGAIVTLGGLLAMALAPWFDVEQQFGLAWLYAARGERVAPAEVVIIAIDETSAQKLGVAARPRDWPRAMHGELVTALAHAGARLIVFDLTFDAPSPQPEDDARFADAIAAAGNVLVTHSLSRETRALAGSSGGEVATVVIERRTPPIPAVEKAVAGSASFVVPKSARVDAYWAVRNDLAELPTLALQRYLAPKPPSAGASFAAPALPPALAARIRSSLMEMQALGDVHYFNLYGPPHTIRTVPYFEVIERSRAAAALPASSRGAASPPASTLAPFRDKAVFVGFSASTAAEQDRLRDDYRTVFSREDGFNTSGVELAATAFANGLEDRALRPASTGAQLAVLLAWAVVLAIIFRHLSPPLAVAAAGALAVAYLSAIEWSFAERAWWGPSIVPIAIELPLAILAGVWLHHRASGREREAIKEAFGYFVPTTVVDQLADNLNSMTSDNRVVFGCCLSTDVSSYTSLAERIDPRALGLLLNAYFAELFGPVERSGGVVIDVVGDAMVAIWTTPGTEAVLRRRACAATLEAAAAIDRFNRGPADRPPLPTRFGLHSGDLLVGHVGGSHHYEYRAVGDIVNTTSRLQGLNKVLGTRVLASAATLAGLEEFLVRPLGSFLFAGKSSVLDVVEMFDTADPGGGVLSEPVLSTFAGALARYREGRWAEAGDGFAAVLAAVPDDGPSSLYHARCVRLLAEPRTPNWTPTIVVDTK